MGENYMILRSLVLTHYQRVTDSSPVHIGDTVDRIGNKVERIGNSRLCCRFVAGFGNNRLSTKSTVLN